MNNWKRWTLVCGVVATLQLAGCFKFQHDHSNNYKPPFYRGENFVPYAVTNTVSQLAGPNSAAAQVTARMPSDWLGLGLGYSYESMLVRLSAMGVQVVRFGDNIIFVLATDNFYKMDSAKLRPQHFDQLIEVASFIDQYTVGDIIIAGYTDNVGSPYYNRELSFNRAQAILAYLWAHGVDHHRLHAYGYGSAHDVADNQSVLGAAYNRRVELHVKVGI